MVQKLKVSDEECGELGGHRARVTNVADVTDILSEFREDKTTP